MSVHLTHEELTDSLLGVSSLTVNAHLLSCPACADELAKLKSSIGSFRDAARAWSESALATGRMVPVVGALPKSSRPKRSWAVNWVLATAMILFAAALTFYVRDYQARNRLNSAQEARPATVVKQSQIERDNELLSQVNSELEEGVPAPMEPLRLLDSTTSSISTTK